MIPRRASRGGPHAPALRYAADLEDELAAASANFDDAVACNATALAEAPPPAPAPKKAKRPAPAAPPAAAPAPAKKAAPAPPGLGAPAAGWQALHQFPCAACGATDPALFSKTQLSKGATRRCKACVSGEPKPPGMAAKPPPQAPVPMDEDSDSELEGYA